MRRISITCVIWYAWSSEMKSSMLRVECPIVQTVAAMAHCAMPSAQTEEGWVGREGRRPLEPDSTHRRLVSESVDLLTDPPITFAGNGFQSLSIQNLDLAATIADGGALLKTCCDMADALTAHTE